ncbi:Alcohol dehydrogenase 4 [Fonsecaea erecta]|uniref:Alcohol dehydrogenase 4 n=1 Tax=Fonsecaea erecta TaxID=1367422 RepID=A0A178ZLK8_9EURO|nr:Alcohol dehydrogenase 4 [Fonsecaea erecta]OAP60689.1 Alcohol dehydrogenase 4 [Fonsecaea erecta]
MSSTEVYRPAFTDPPGTNLAGIPVSNLRLSSPCVSYGLPYQVACAKHVRETFKASRVYIIASGTLSRETDRLDRLIEAIGKDKVVGVRKGITPHTPFSQVLQITAEARDANADCLVTLGAGSITDGAKVVTFALANNIKTANELARYSSESTDIPSTIHEPKVPLITIPTSLSGGEYFSLGGGTDDATKHKVAFLHSGMGVNLVILDAELCITTPPYHWLSTGVRSLDHCVEAICSLESTETSDRKAEEGLRLLVPSLLKCKQDPQDLEARHNCQMAVILAMDNIRAGIPMGGSHAIGHQLGPLGVAHGVTSCILCPAVMKYNIKHADGNPEIISRQGKVRNILWSEPAVAEQLVSQGLGQDTADLGDMLDVVIRALDLPRTLSELGIGREVFPSLAESALADFWSPTNPVPLLKAEQVQEILEAVV